MDDLAYSTDEPADLTAARRAVALELVAEGSNLSEAARGVGVNRSTLFRWRQADPAFDLALRQAFVANVETLKREAERRAMNGSDKLLMFLLCNYAPDQFSNAQKIEHSGGIDVSKMSEAEIDAEMARLAAELVPGFADAADLL